MMVWALMLFLSGMILIVAEFLLPGGVLGGIGALMLIVSTVVGVRAFPDAAVFIIAGELLGAFVCVLVGFFLLTNTKMGRAIALQDTQRLEDGYVNIPDEKDLIGAVGTVLAALRPSGTVILGDRRIDAVSNGEYLAKDTPVRVIEVYGNRVVVEADSEKGD